MGRNNADFHGAVSGDFNEKHLNKKYDDEGRSNPANWGNKDDHKTSKPQKITSDFKAPDYADHYEERNT